MTEQEVRYAILQAQEKAEQGDIISQHFLGISYLGLKDYAIAAKWFEKAADQGYADAQMRLGLQLFTGQGIPEDKVKGLEWIRKAAEQGYARAQFHMGNFTDDDVKSAEWYEKAAEQGDADAQYELGILYFNGEGVPKDNIKAGQWFNKANEQGNEKAKEYLGKVITDELFNDPEIQAQRNAAAHKFYIEGNHGKAAELYGEMADRGNAMAQYKLGLLYGLGQGVQYNSAKSNELIHKAAAQGLNEAKDWLKEREEKERKEREHQEWLATDDSKNWQKQLNEKAAELKKNTVPEKKKGVLGHIFNILFVIYIILLILLFASSLSGYNDITDVLLVSVVFSPAAIPYILWLIITKNIRKKKEKIYEQIKIAYNEVLDSYKKAEDTYRENSKSVK